MKPHIEILELGRTQPTKAVLIVDNLPKGFGKIDKSDGKNPPKVSRSEAILLNSVARIILDIFIREPL